MGQRAQLWRPVAVNAKTESVKRRPHLKAMRLRMAAIATGREIGGVETCVIYFFAKNLRLRLRLNGKLGPAVNAKNEKREGGKPGVCI